MGKSSRRRREAKAESSKATSRAEARREARGDDAGSGGVLSRLAPYRVAIGALVAVTIVGFVGFALFSTATASDYTCGSLLEAPPSQISDPAPGESVGQLGFPTASEGARHSDGSITYSDCPPTSGEHRAAGALARDFYDASSIQVPNDWVHNLEHGYAIIAYKGEPEQEVLDGIRAAMDGAEPSEVAVSCGLPNKVIALRFDDMSTPYAVLAWQWAFLMDPFDEELMTEAAAQFQDRPTAPERAC